MKDTISTFGRSIEEAVKNLDVLIEHVKSSSISSRSTEESEKTVNNCYFVNAVLKSDRGTFLAIRRI